MMILSIIATVVLLGVLFYHRVSYSQQLNFARPGRLRFMWLVCGQSGCWFLWPLFSYRLT